VPNLRDFGIEASPAGRDRILQRIIIGLVHQAALLVLIRLCTNAHNGISARGPVLPTTVVGILAVRWTSAMQSCSFRLVVAIRAPAKTAGVAAFLPEFDVGNVVDGLPVAAVAGLFSRCHFGLHVYLMAYSAPETSIHRNARNFQKVALNIPSFGTNLQNN
jgi:hypothetical protein